MYSPCSESTIDLIAIRCTPYAFSALPSAIFFAFSYSASILDSADCAINTAQRILIRLILSLSPRSDVINGDSRDMLIASKEPVKSPRAKRQIANT
ncbi:unannotated protein [freshwater metagenome]|uniref:Unannotated protein n=1 Tax=freshwater metagenome TaxID=449393 RepID=A0A6J6N5G7_9ZZZZ